ncbi:hypothetical protein [Achromobacter xylosoxidans]
MVSTSPVPVKRPEPARRFLTTESAPTTDRQNTLPANLKSVVSGYRPASSLGLLGLPEEFIEQIGAPLDHADYLNLRSTCAGLRDILPPPKAFIKDLFKLRGEKAERVLFRVNKAISNQLKSPISSSSLSALQNIKVDGCPNGIVLNFEYALRQDSKDQKLQGLIDKFFNAVENGLPDIDEGSSNYRYEKANHRRYRELRIAMSRRRVQEKLPVLFGAAYDICTAEESGVETLVLASMMSATKDFILQRNWITQDEMHSITQPYRSLFKVGDSMQKEHRASA